MDNDDLSINNMLETAMAFSMAPMFTQSMASVCKANINAIETAYNQGPPRYIYAMINGKQQGPFSMGEILERIWKAGLQEWKKAKDVEDIRPNLEQLPPPLPQF